LSQIGDGILGAYTSEGNREAARILAPYEEVFDLVRRARAKPACRFRRNYEDPLKEHGPEWIPVCTLSRALSVRAQIQASEGRREEARETVKDLWALAAAFKDEPLAWSQMARLHVWGMAREATVSCARGSEDAPEWDRWLELLPDPSSLQQSVMLGFRGHLAWWASDALKGHGYGVEALSPHSTAWERMLARVFKPLLDIGAAKGLRRYQADISRWERAPFDYRKELYLDENPMNRGLLHISLVELLSPYQQGYLRRMALVHSATVVARAGMECERTWCREGRYPETLAQTDPLTGRSLEFTEDGASLRSASPPAPHNFSYDPEEEGLVWNLLHGGD
jgi:hypothetical protein